MTSGPPIRSAIDLPENEDDGIPRGARLMILSLVLAKVATIVVVLLVEFSWTTGALVAITTWTWIVVGAVLLSGPAAFAYRLRKVRARRAALEREEWLVGPAVKGTPGTAQPPAGGD